MEQLKHTLVVSHCAISIHVSAALVMVDIVTPVCRVEMKQQLRLMCNDMP
jgi:hypothetical protein